MGSGSLDGLRCQKAWNLTAVVVGGQSRNRNLRPILLSPAQPGPGLNPEKVTHPLLQLQDQRQSASEGRAADHSAQAPHTAPPRSQVSCAPCSFLLRPLSPAELPSRTMNAHQAPNLRMSLTPIGHMCTNTSIATGPAMATGT